MGPSEDRKQRDLDLLAKSHRALQAERNGEVPPAERPEPDPPYRLGARAERAANGDRGDSGERGDAGERGETGKRGANGRGDQKESAPGDGDDGVRMYRGRPVRVGSNQAPGAGSGKARQFRAAGSSRKKKSNRRSADGDSLKEALAKLTELHDEGLITRAEFDSKRRQILDRL